MSLKRECNEFNDDFRGVKTTKKIPKL